MDRGIELFLKKYSAEDSPTVDCTIHPSDEMYTYSAERIGANKSWMNYFMLGGELTRTIAQIANWKFPGRIDHVQVLEFACGHGRNVRHTVKRFPARNVFVSDIYESAVAFNIDQFGVRGRLSVHDPKELKWEERFDLIVVPSLFSHLPESTFAAWIKALYGLLTDRGVLAFSVHGEHLLSSDVVIPESGIHFLAESESSTLDPNEYGLSYVTEAFVREQIRKATGSPSYSMTRRGFWQHQDLYLVTKDEECDIAKFRYDRGLVARISQIELDESGGLAVSGWTKETHQAENEGVAVRVYLDHQLVGETTTFTSRPDVAKVWNDNDFTNTGFSVSIPSLPPNPERTSLVVVEVVSRGHREYIHVLPIGEYIPEPPALPVIEEPMQPPVLPVVEEPMQPPVLSVIEEATRPHRPIWRRILGRSRRIVREQYHRLTA
jgi:SAM-dependent methyltransferase